MPKKDTRLQQLSESILKTFPEFGRIYNGRNGLSLEDFYKTYYRQEAELEQFGIRLTWVLSQVHTDLAGIHRGYPETQEAFPYRFLYGRGGIIPCRDTREKQFDFTGMEDERMEYRLLSYIKEEEKGQSAGELLAKVQSQCGIGEASSLEAVSCYKYDLLIRFSGIIHQLGADRLRIDHAKKLLEETSDTMETVAVSSGFLSSSTFIKVFKKSEGITPGAYRKLKQN